MLAYACQRRPGGAVEVGHRVMWTPDADRWRAHPSNPLTRSGNAVSPIQLAFQGQADGQTAWAELRKNGRGRGAANSGRACPCGVCFECTQHGAHVKLNEAAEGDQRKRRRRVRPGWHPARAEAFPPPHTRPGAGGRAAPGPRFWKPGDPACQKTRNVGPPQPRTAPLPATRPTSMRPPCGSEVSRSVFTPAPPTAHGPGPASTPSG
jgi:hypothetical protein